MSKILAAVCMLPFFIEACATGKMESRAIATEGLASVALGHHFATCFNAEENKPGNALYVIYYQNNSKTSFKKDSKEEFIIGELGEGGSLISTTGILTEATSSKRLDLEYKTDFSEVRLAIESDGAGESTVSRRESKSTSAPKISKLRCRISRYEGS